MKKYYFVFLALNLVCFSLLVNLQGQSFRIRSDNFIQIGYGTYKALTFGIGDGTTNNGQWAVEHWENGFNIARPCPASNCRNYFLFIKDNNGYVGFGVKPTYSLQLGSNTANNSAITLLGAELWLNRYNATIDMAFIEARNNTTSSIGLRFRTQNSGSIVDAMHIFPNGNVQCYKNLTWGSDERLKKDIKNFKKSDIDKLYQLNTVNFEYSSANDTLDNKSTVSGTDIKTKRNYGIIAQEIKELYPDLVFEDSKYLSVNYIGFIPLLIEALKEQRKKIQLLENKISSLNNSVKSTLNVSEQNNLSSVLYQNNPNPFSENTEIKYYLQDETNIANLYIYNIQGKQIKNINIFDRGESKIIISALELEAGIYYYSLIADGNEVDTKKMILTD